MRKLAFGAITIGLLAIAACGGSGGDDGVQLIDGAPAPDSAPAACNALAQTGCQANEKCAWVFLNANFTSGALKCVPDGTVATDQSCNYDQTDTSNIYDNCVHGDTCNGVCEPICGVAPDTCATGSACTQYNGLFDGQSPKIGLCNYLCDPVSQLREGSTTACNAADATWGCYPTGGGSDSFTCSNEAPNADTATQDARAVADSQGNPYPNGCAPGYMPVFKGPAGGADAAFYICSAFCTPHTTDTQDTTAPGGVSNPSQGQYSCSDRQATTSDCLFYWGLEENGNFAPTTPPNYPNVGFCYNYGSYGDVSCATEDPTVDNVKADGTAGADGIKDYIEALCGAYGSTFTANVVKSSNAGVPAHRPAMVPTNERKPNLN